MWHFKCGNLHLELHPICAQGQSPSEFRTVKSAPHPTCAQGQGFVRFSDEEVTASPLCGEAGVFSLTNFAVCSLNLGLCWGDIGGISGFVRYNRGYKSFLCQLLSTFRHLQGDIHKKRPTASSLNQVSQAI